MLDFSKLTDLLWKPRILSATTIGTAILLFVPSDKLEMLGLADFARERKSWIGVLFLLSSLVLIAHVLVGGMHWARSRWRDAARMKILAKNLNGLSPEEKEILRAYMHKETKTLILEYGNGVVGSLVDASIIYPAEGVSGAELHPVTRRLIHPHPYNLQPWAWTYLRSHPEVLR